MLENSDITSVALRHAELFPVAIVIAFLANSSGFSGGVLFQPIIYFTQSLPLSTSIATGIASETIGMTGGAFRYQQMKKISWPIILPSLLWIFLGVCAGYTIFHFIPQRPLKFLLALVLISVALLKIWELYSPPKTSSTNYGPAWRPLVGFLGGIGSASTGTGVCELHQPLFERVLRQRLIAANAAAITCEAWGNLWISAFNLNWGMIDFSVLMWTGPGVIIGSQLGARYSDRIPAHAMKLLFSLAVLSIGLFYLKQTI